MEVNSMPRQKQGRRDLYMKDGKSATCRGVINNSKTEQMKGVVYIEVYLNIVMTRQKGGSSFVYRNVVKYSDDKAER